MTSRFSEIESLTWVHASRVDGWRLVCESLVTSFTV